MNDQEVEVSAGNKKLRLRGSDLLTAIIGIIVCSGLTLTAYILIQHRADAAQHSVTLTEVLKEISDSTRESIAVQREMNCLISLPQDRREGQAEFCRRVTR